MQKLIVSEFMTLDGVMTIPDTLKRMVRGASCDRFDGPLASQEGR
jgi:hypothetical protein